MRKICYQILRDYEQKQSYLNLKLKNLDNEQYPVNQIALRVYGIVANNQFLDYLVDELVERQKIDKSVRLILKMQIFEYRFLNKDEYVCVSEGVKLAKVYCKSASGFINAHLRKLKKIKQLEPTFANVEKNIAIKYSHPRFIVKMLKAQYPDDYIQILASNIEVKNTYVRKVKNLLEPEKFKQIQPFSDLYQYIGQSIVTSDDFINDTIIIQDLGSYLVGKLVAANKTETILDLCAAPGNKTMHIAPDAKLVVSNELHAHRVQVLANNVQKHKLDNVIVINSDASDYDNLVSSLQVAKLSLKYDKILIDAPCSGWGVIKSKPEIKYNHTKTDIDQICEISKKIVENSLNFLKDDGQIIFSTCTLNREENDYLIEEICKKYNLSEVVDEDLVKFTQSTFDTGICLKNYVYNSDSFYMIKLERNE